ncbi:unnamed protein product [Owenia fusiformis]|uniref:Nuclear receptor coactivator 6 TRADD-N domain-containing protein n=1 Tax=Owenia fusiformis TaxID=6347 RepID=A0A8S4N2Y4_OWEFU|nr:unnamed protein product [Owenia fusiformis]
MVIMGPHDEEYVEAQLTCKGDFYDPEFHSQLLSLSNRLQQLIQTDKERRLIIKKVEPWNSVRVTFNIPKEAALRLKQLAEQGDRTLRELGIMAVQIEGDRAISLTIAGKNNETTELVFRTGPSKATKAPGSVFDMSSSEEGPSVPGPSDTTRRNIAQYLSQGGPATSLFDSLFTVSQAGPTTGEVFKSPNTIATTTDPIPFRPVSSSVTSFTSPGRSPSHAVGGMLLPPGRSPTNYPSPSSTPQHFSSPGSSRSQQSSPVSPKLPGSPSTGPPSPGGRIHFPHPYPHGNGHQRPVVAHSQGKPMPGMDSTGSITNSSPLLVNLLQTDLSGGHVVSHQGNPPHPPHMHINNFPVNRMPPPHGLDVPQQPPKRKRKPRKPKPKPVSNDDGIRIDIVPNPYTTERSTLEGRQDCIINPYTGQLEPREKVEQLGELISPEKHAHDKGSPPSARGIPTSIPQYRLHATSNVQNQVTSTNSLPASVTDTIAAPRPPIANTTPQNQMAVPITHPKPPRSEEPTKPKIEEQLSPPMPRQEIPKLKLKLVRKNSKEYVTSETKNDESDIATSSVNSMGSPSRVCVVPSSVTASPPSTNGPLVDPTVRHLQLSDNGLGMSNPSVDSGVSMTSESSHNSPPEDALKSVSDGTQGAHTSLGNYPFDETSSTLHQDEEGRSVKQTVVQSGKPATSITVAYALDQNTPDLSKRLTSNKLTDKIPPPGLLKESLNKMEEVLGHGKLFSKGLLSQEPKTEHYDFMEKQNTKTEVEKSLPMLNGPTWHVPQDHPERTKTILNCDSDYQKGKIHVNRNSPIIGCNENERNSRNSPGCTNRNSPLIPGVYGHVYENHTSPLQPGVSTSLQHPGVSTSLQHPGYPGVSNSPSQLSYGVHIPGQSQGSTGNNRSSPVVLHSSRGSPFNIGQVPVSRRNSFPEAILGQPTKTSHIMGQDPSPLAKSSPAALLTQLRTQSNTASPPGVEQDPTTTQGLEVRGNIGSPSLELNTHSRSGTSPNLELRGHNNAQTLEQATAQYMARKPNNTPNRDKSRTLTSTSIPTQYARHHINPSGHSGHMNSSSAGKHTTVTSATDHQPVTSSYPPTTNICPPVTSSVSSVSTSSSVSNAGYTLGITSGTHSATSEYTTAGLPSQVQPSVTTVNVTSSVTTCVTTTTQPTWVSDPRSSVSTQESSLSSRSVTTREQNVHEQQMAVITSSQTLAASAPSDSAHLHTKSRPISILKPMIERDEEIRNKFDEVRTISPVMEKDLLRDQQQKDNQKERKKRNSGGSRAEHITDHLPLPNSQNMKPHNKGRSYTIADILAAAANKTAKSDALMNMTIESMYNSTSEQIRAASPSQVATSGHKSASVQIVASGHHSTPKVSALPKNKTKKSNQSVVQVDGLKDDFPPNAHHLTNFMQKSMRTPSNSTLHSITAPQYASHLTDSVQKLVKPLLSVDGGMSENLLPDTGPSQLTSTHNAIARISFEPDGVKIVKEENKACLMTSLASNECHHQMNDVGTNSTSMMKPDKNHPTSTSDTPTPSRTLAEEVIVNNKAHITANSLSPHNTQDVAPSQLAPGIEPPHNTQDVMPPFKESDTGPQPPVLTQDRVSPEVKSKQENLKDNVDQNINLSKNTSDSQIVEGEQTKVTTLEPINDKKLPMSSYKVVQSINNPSLNKVIRIQSTIPAKSPISQKPHPKILVSSVPYTIISKTPVSSNGPISLPSSISLTKLSAKTVDSPVMQVSSDNLGNFPEMNALSTSEVKCSSPIAQISKQKGLTSSLNTIDVSKSRTVNKLKEPSESKTIIVTKLDPPPQEKPSMIIKTNDQIAAKQKIQISVVKQESKPGGDVIKIKQLESPKQGPAKIHIFVSSPTKEMKDNKPDMDHSADNAVQDPLPKEPIEPETITATSSENPEPNIIISQQSSVSSPPLKRPIDIKNLEENDPVIPAKVARTSSSEAVDTMADDKVDADSIATRVTRQHSNDVKVEQNERPASPKVKVLKQKSAEAPTPILPDSHSQEDKETTPRAGRITRRSSRGSRDSNVSTASLKNDEESPKITKPRTRNVSECSSEKSLRNKSKERPDSPTLNYSLRTPKNGNRRSTSSDTTVDSISPKDELRSESPRNIPTLRGAKRKLPVADTPVNTANATTLNKKTKSESETKECEDNVPLSEINDKKGKVGLRSNRQTGSKLDEIIPHVPAPDRASPRNKSKPVVAKNKNGTKDEDITEGDIIHETRSRTNKPQCQITEDKKDNNMKIIVKGQKIIDSGTKDTKEKVLNKTWNANSPVKESLESDRVTRRSTRSCNKTKDVEITLPVVATTVANSTRRKR